MNIDVFNIKHYRVTNNSDRIFQLFNRNTNRVENITKAQFFFIMEYLSSEACDVVMDSIDTKENE